MPMRYYEDNIWLKDNFWKTAIGTAYITLGFVGIALNIITISILPDLKQFIPKYLLLLLCAHYLTSIIQILVIFIPIPTMIAVEKPYFVNEIMINLPSFILLTFQSTSILMMMFISVGYNVEAMNKLLCELIWNKVTAPIMVLFSVVFSVHFTNRISSNSGLRRFNVTELVWIITPYESISISYLVVVVSAICLLFYAITFSDLLYKFIFDRDENIDNDSVNIKPSTQIKIMIYHLILDALFCVIICLLFLLNNRICSLLHVYLTSYWPAVTLIFTNLPARSVIFHRCRGIFQPHMAHAPIVIRNGLDQ